jgi:hypothetical protein
MAPQPGCSWFETCKENVLEVPDDEVCFVLLVVFYNFLTSFRIAVGKLVVAQIVKKLHASCGVWKFIVMFIWACHWFLS